MTKTDLSILSIEELKQLEKEVNKAIKSFEVRRRKEALFAIELTAKEHGFSLSELIPDAEVRPRVAAKYQHPENVALTWSGRGRKPKWFKEQLEAGKTPDELAI